jgi:sugar/nucleoside kinase (ribokinase family)
MFSGNKKFLVIGNITKDIIKTLSGEEAAYGGNTYSSIAANALGWNSTVLTKGNEEISEWIKELENLGIEVLLQQDKSCTIFCNDYTSGVRRQKLLGRTDEIKFDLKEKFDVIHINPLFKEVSVELIEKARKKCKILSLDVQGIVREVEDGVVDGKFLEDREEWFKNVDILKVGDAEIKYVSKEKNPESICRDLKSFGPKVVTLTYGENGAYVLGKDFHKIPVFPTKEIDPTGAGDVYETAFEIKYFETRNERDAGFFGSAAASFVVEDFGSKNIQTRNKVEERYNILMKEAD